MHILHIGNTVASDHLPTCNLYVLPFEVKMCRWNSCFYAEMTKTMVWNQQQQQNYGDEHTNPLKMNTN